MSMSDDDNRTGAVELTGDEPALQATEGPEER